jgi:hypothetical protein
VEEWETIYIWLPKALGLGFLRATQEPKYENNLFSEYFEDERIKQNVFTQGMPFK